MNLQHDDLNNTELKALELEVRKKSEGIDICFPNLMETVKFEKLEQLMVTDKNNASPRVRITIPESVLNMLRNLKNLNIYTFKHVQFESIRQNFLTKDLHIETLELTDIDLGNLLADTLANLTMLKKLNIHKDNKIKSIHEEFFSNNRQLEQINIKDGSKVKTLSEKLLANLVNLKTIYLFFNYVTTIPEMFFANNHQLEKVILEFEKLRFLPANLFKNNANLNFVDLTGKQISSIPDSLFAFNHELDYVSITYTKITKLPEDLLKTLKKLNLVDFSFNQIGFIPQNFFTSNEKLAQIDLQGNKISELPKTLLKRLSESLWLLNLKDNPMKSFPENYFKDDAELIGKEYELKRKIMLGKSTSRWSSSSDD